MELLSKGRSFMEHILLTENLSIKKPEPNNSKDCWLLQKLDEDKTISGDNGYLWRLENCFDDIRYLYSSEFYGSPYVIYNQNDPVGFFDVSPIWWRNVCESVELSYALLKEARGKGYMTQVLRAVANQILTDNLNDIKEVSLSIHPENDESKRVALNAGFVSDGLSKEEQYKQGYALYEKTKVLALKEINKK